MENSVEITNQSEIARLRKIANDIVMDTHHFNMDWVSKKRWFIIPSESGITDEEATRLSAACHTFGYSECFAIATEPKPLGPECYIFATTTHGILETSYEFEPNDHVFFPEDRGFAFLRPFGLYSLLAGPIEFVQIAVGSNIEIARKIFWEFANDSNWPEADRSHLTSIAKKYEAISLS